MEKELNIAAILKDKPTHTRLWSPLYGEVFFNRLVSEGGVRVLCRRLDGSLGTDEKSFWKNGKFTLGGEVCLFPSKAMQYWSKFAWKKGDVLRYSDILVMFGGWVNGDYTQFKAAFECKYGSNLFVGGIIYYTSDFCKATDDVANNFIKKLEDYYGGKLNLKTLEIERNPQFKDGDIVVLDDDGKSHFKTILLYQSNIEDKYEVYSFLNAGTMFLSFEATLMDDRKARLATDSEKQQLFSALVKEGKRWNADTKTLEDLPKKCEFKAFDKVLVRNYNDEVWRANIFSHIIEDADFPYTCIEDYYRFCIPYNEETKHLLGTTDDWKGGEENE